MECLQRQRQVTVTQLAGALRIAELDRRQLLEDERDVVDMQVGAQRARGFGPPEQALVEPLCALGFRGQLLGRPKRPR